MVKNISRIVKYVMNAVKIIYFGFSCDSLYSCGNYRTEVACIL